MFSYASAIRKDKNRFLWRTLSTFAIISCDDKRGLYLTQCSILGWGLIKPYLIVFFWSQVSIDPAACIKIVEFRIICYVLDISHRLGSWKWNFSLINLFSYASAIRKDKNRFLWRALSTFTIISCDDKWGLYLTQCSILGWGLIKPYLIVFFWSQVSIDPAACIKIVEFSIICYVLNVSHGLIWCR